MIENIRNEFKLMLNELDWMDAKSKKAANEKADFIDVKIGYPDYTFNDTHLNDLYKRVSRFFFFSFLIHLTLRFCIYPFK